MDFLHKLPILAVVDDICSSNRSVSIAKSKEVLSESVGWSVGDEIEAHFVLGYIAASFNRSFKNTAISKFNSAFPSEIYQFFKDFNITIGDFNGMSGGYLETIVSSSFYTDRFANLGEDEQAKRFAVMSLSLLCHKSLLSGLESVRLLYPPVTDYALRLVNADLDDAASRTAVMVKNGPGVFYSPDAFEWAYADGWGLGNGSPLDDNGCSIKVPRSAYSTRIFSAAGYYTSDCYAEIDSELSIRMLGYRLCSDSEYKTQAEQLSDLLVSLGNEHASLLSDHAECAGRALEIARLNSRLSEVESTLEDANQRVDALTSEAATRALEYNELTAAKATLVEELEAVKAAFVSMTSEKDTIAASLVQKDAKIASLNGEKDYIESQLADTSTELDRLTVQVEHLGKELAEANKNVRHLEAQLLSRQDLDLRNDRVL